MHQVGDQPRLYCDAARSTNRQDESQGLKPVLSKYQECHPLNPGCLTTDSSTDWLNAFRCANRHNKKRDIQLEITLLCSVRKFLFNILFIIISDFIFSLVIFPPSFWGFFFLTFLHVLLPFPTFSARILLPPFSHSVFKESLTVQIRLEDCEVSYKS